MKERKRRENELKTQRDKERESFEHVVMFAFDPLTSLPLPLSPSPSLSLPPSFFLSLSLSLSLASAMGKKGKSGKARCVCYELQRDRVS